MTRHRLLPTLLLALCAAAAFPTVSTAATVDEPRLVRIPLDQHLSAADLLRAGLDVVEVKSTYAKILEWPRDVETLQRLGIAPQVLDAHPGETAAARTAAELRVRRPIGPEHDGHATLAAPPVGAGSLGGFWTLEEVKMKLDELVANDVNDVVADQLDTLGYSVQGRPIWGLELGKTVAGPDERPVAYFNALTHAREPEGMQALLYFVEDILARYGTDPFATSLLDHRVIYVCPVVNPDGYMVNQNIYFDSGGTIFGFWRKNTGDNNGNMVFDSSVDGVDLNRNYGYRWGIDNQGSNPWVGSQTYRGPSAFSEPETQIQRDIITALEPRTGQSFHSYSDVVIHPWGFTSTPTPDDAAFREWSDELVRDNGYQSNYVYPLLGYIVNGEFNDWAYGDSTKPKMFSWTPEVGSEQDHFWPPPSRIVPLAEENLRVCYVTAAIAGAWVQIDDFTILEGHLNASYSARISVRARNLGLSDAGPGLTAEMEPLDAGVEMIRSSVAYPTLSTRTSGDPVEPFQVLVHDTVTAGRLLRFAVTFTDPSGLYSRDTLAVPCGTPTVLVSDGASAGLGLWDPGDWDIVMNDPAHPSAYFSDTPGYSYPIYSNNALTLLSTLDLSAGVHAYAVYEAIWDIERDYDAASIEASLDGSSWSPLSATGTTPGDELGVQTVGEPLYTGTRRRWKTDLADLSAFTGAAGNTVHLRYRMRSDGGDPSFTGYPGFSFDSLRVWLFDPGAQPVLVAVGDPASPPVLELSGVWPNPVRSGARFAFALPRPGHVRLEIVDVTGRHVRTLADGDLPAARHLRTWDLRSDGGRKVEPGVFFARLRSGPETVNRRFVVVH